MDIKTAHRMLDVQEQLLLDNEYTELIKEYRNMNKTFYKTLSELNQKHRTIINDYLSICVSLHLHILKIACTSDEIATKPPSDVGGGTA